MPVDCGDRLVELLDQVDVVVVAHPVGAAEVVRVEQLAEAYERVPIVAIGERDVRRVDLANHHVVAVVAVRARTAERERLVDRRGEPAALADHGRRRRYPHAAIPDRALNARIASSHSGSRSRSERQNAWSSRATKSSTETPCCSTHVK